MSLSILDHLPRGKAIFDFIRGGAASFVIQVGNRLVMLAVGALLARLLGVTGYGVYAFAMACMTVLVLFADVGVAQLTLRNTAAAMGRENRAEAAGSIVTGGLITSVLALVVCLLALGVTYNLQFEQSQAVLIMLFALPMAALLKFGCHSLRGLGQVALGQALERLVVPLFALTGLAAVLWLSEGPQSPQVALWVQFAAFSGGVLIAAFSVVQFLRRGELARVAWRPYFRAALPFALLGGVGILNTQIDILMLGVLSDSDQVGLYRVAVLGAALVAFGLQAANVVLPTLFARLQAQDDQAQLQSLVTLSSRLILLGALPDAVVLWAFGVFLITLVFGGEFAPAYEPMAVLVAGELMGASLGSMGFLLSMSGKESQALRVLMVCAVFNVLLNLILIPLFGMMGAAAATAIGQVLRLVLLYRLVTSALQLSPSPLYGLWSGRSARAQAESRSGDE